MTFRHQPVDDVRKIDRALDRFLNHELVRQAMLMRERGASSYAVRKFKQRRRDDYEATEQQALVLAISFVLDRPVAVSQRRDLQ